MIDGVIPVAKRADVGFMPHDSNSLIASGEFRGNVRRAIGRSIVVNDQLEVAIGLIEKRLNRLGEILLAVVHHKTDRNARRVHTEINQPRWPLVENPPRRAA